MRGLVAALDALVFAHALEAPRVGTWRPLVGGPARRSLLWRVDARGVRRVVKVHHSPLADGTREAWALARLPEDVGPTLVARFDGATLRRRRARGVAPALVARLDRAAAGAVLVMSDVGGRAALRPSARTIAALARCVARMHTISARTGPTPVLPDDPRRLAATITRWLDEAWARRLVTPGERRAATRVLTRPTRAARSLTDAPMRRVVHGDLRWSNARFTADGARLVDFEHAGLGDPALDLALLTWRAPLSPDVEARFLDVYTAERSPRAASRLRTRHDALLPLVAVASALAALLDAASPGTSSLGAALDRLAERG